MWRRLAPVQPGATTSRRVREGGVCVWVRVGGGVGGICKRNQAGLFPAYPAKIQPNMFTHAWVRLARTFPGMAIEKPWGLGFSVDV
jgi:hypothetical protein